MNLNAQDVIDRLDADRLSESDAAQWHETLQQDPTRRQELARDWRIHRLLALTRLDHDIGERLVASLRFARPVDHRGNDAFAARLRHALAQRSRHLSLRWIAAALVAVAVISGWLLIAPAQLTPGQLAPGQLAAEPVVARVVTAHDAMLVQTDGKRLPLPPEVRAGDTVLTTSESVTLAWINEPTALVIGPQSHVRVSIKAGAKRLDLEQGRLDAEVAPQPVDKPLVIATHEATATVLGTTLTVRRDATGTHVDVGHGRVRLAGIAQGSVEVSTGQRASATSPSAVSLSTTIRAPSGLAAGFDPPFIENLDTIAGTNLLPEITNQSPVFRSDFTGVLQYQDHGPRPDPWHANSWIAGVTGVFELRDEPQTGERALCLRPTTAQNAVQAFLWPALPLAAGRSWRLTLDYLTTPGVQAQIAIGLENVRSRDLPLPPSTTHWRRIGCRIPSATQVRGFNLLLQIHGGGVGEALYFRNVRLVPEP